jgi:hypothetical protein
MSQEFDLGEMEIDFISFVPRGANRKKCFLVKENRALKDDILKSILETDEYEISRVLKEAWLEARRREFWRQPSCSRPAKTSCRRRLCRSWPKPAGCPSLSRRERATPKRRERERERKERALLGRSSPKKPWRRWTLLPRPLSSSSWRIEATKSEARRRESEGRIKRHGWREHSFAPSIIIIHY